METQGPLKLKDNKVSTPEKRPKHIGFYLAEEPRAALYMIFISGMDAKISLEAYHA